MTSRSSRSIWRPGRAFSRRQVLGGAGALAAAALFPGCLGGDDDDPDASPTLDLPTGPTGVRPEATSTAAAGPYVDPTEPRYGGSIRYTGFVTGDQIYDPHKTQAAPFAGMQAAVFSRLIAYADQGTGELEADLAESVPEQPDSTTWIFSLREDAHWQDLEPVNGRAVTAEDIKFSIERQRDGNAEFPRKAHWVNVEDIEVPNDQTIIIRTQNAFAPMLSYFAEPHAFVVAPELVEAGFGPDMQVGSGPFSWLEWNEGDFVSLGRNVDFRNGTAPYLDGVTMEQMTDAIEVEALLRTRRLDVAFLSRRQAQGLREGIPDLLETHVGDSRFWGMRLRVSVPPYNDARVRKAMSLAVDRRAMLERFFDGSGELNPWVSWPVSNWALPPQELQSMPGYRAGAEGREADIADAKQLIAAYTSGGGKLPEQVGLVVLDSAEALFGMGTMIKEQMAAVLGLNVVVYPVTLERLITGLVDPNVNERFPWVAGPDNGWLDLDDWTYPYFHSRGTRNTFALRDDVMDGLVERQRTELDEATRRETGFEIQRRLLEINPGVNFLSERIIALSWPYVHDFPLGVADGYQHQLARAWVDSEHPLYTRRR